MITGIRAVVGEGWAGRSYRHFQRLIRYRELIRNFVVRDLQVRYRNSVLGFLWSLANPLLMMAVFTVVFTTLMPQGIDRFPVFVLSGLLAWNWCINSIRGGIVSITGNAHLIKKVAFPREFLPLSLVLSEGVNFTLALVPLLAVAWAYGLPPTAYLALLPIVMVVQLFFVTGMALFLSALNVSFRDTEPIMDVLLLAWFFLTPVFFAVENLSQQYARVIYILNPMASIISIYRLIFYHQAPPAVDFFARVTVQALVVFAIGYAFFLWRSPDFGEDV